MLGVPGKEKARHVVRASMLARQRRAKKNKASSAMTMRAKRP
jgi:hypothetical protein